MKIPRNNYGRVLVWFSCGAASAVAAKLAVEAYPNDLVEILYCDTLAFESSDNPRFMADVSKWIGREIKILKNPKYADIYEVFQDVRYLKGRYGAPCTKFLKRNVRKAYQEHGDVHIFGLTFDEKKRIRKLERENPELELDWNLRDRKITKNDCYKIVKKAGIQLPLLYRQGYNNNNCIGCVKGGAGYWNKIRVDYPEHFALMSAMERSLGYAINRIKDKPCFLDELDPEAGRHEKQPDIECGAQCVSPTPVKASRERGRKI